MKNLTLVLMAAGKGSRYGGLKQLEKFGPQEATLAEYALWDALNAGFDSFIVVVSENTRLYFEQLFQRVGIKNARCVLQSVSNVPQDTPLARHREKPWGTAHALWCAARYIETPFVVINADDFYGSDSYSQAAEFLLRQNDFALLGYRLSDTLSKFGHVSRAVCSVSEKGILQSLKEYRSIEKKSDKIMSSNESETLYFRGDEIVSVNFWALQPHFLPILEVELKNFLIEFQNSETAECYLPEAITLGSKTLRADIHVLSAKDPWMGVTYPQDKAWVDQRLYELTAQRRYPIILF